MIAVRVPLRISLAGGGSDLSSHYKKHGGAVVSFTIDKYIYITAKRNSSLFPNNYRLVYSTVEEVNNRNEIKHPIIRQLANDYGLGSLDLDVMSDIPAGTGMGSSSAFTVGLHKALNPTLTGYRLAEYACVTEINDLKEPIGKQDQYAAAFGGLNHIHFTDKQVTVDPIMMQPEAEAALLNSLHLIYIGGSRSASEQLKEQTETDHSATLDIMAGMAYDLAQTLRSGDLSNVGPIVYSNWMLKRGLSPNVSNTRIDTIIETAMGAGATGGKLLGAGGAGFVLLVCPPAQVSKMIDALRPLTPKYVPFTLEREGAKVLYAE